MRYSLKLSMHGYSDFIIMFVYEHVAFKILIVYMIKFYFVLLSIKLWLELIERLTCWSRVNNNRYTILTTKLPAHDTYICILGAMS